MWVRKVILKKNRKQLSNPSMMYSIPKLYIQNNLPNTTNCENKCFFCFFYFFVFLFYFILFYIYSNSGFEYRIKEMKSGHIIFWNQTCHNTIDIDFHVDEIMIKVMAALSLSINSKNWTQFFSTVRIEPNFLHRGGRRGTIWVQSHRLQADCFCCCCCCFFL